jgi:hypothetical protein
MVGCIIFKDVMAINLKKIKGVGRIPFLKTKQAMKVFLGATGCFDIMSKDMQ